MTADSDPILEVSGITKSFPGVRALDAVGLHVRPGRLLAVLGENGAGKSTLMNILAGVLRPEAGALRLRGREVSFESPQAALAAGIAIVFQELSLIPHLSVAENIFLGREPRTRCGLIDFSRLNAAAAAVLKRLGLAVDPAAPVADLRLGEQQLIEIARALSQEAGVLILDEPTSSLSARETELLFGALAELKQSGVALIYITHKLDELEGICDDVLVLRDGRAVGGARWGDLSRDRLIHLMAGREPKESFQRSLPNPGPELLRADSVTLPALGAGRRNLVDGVSFTLHRGEVLGIFGLVGAGRTELLETLFGLHPGRAGGRLALGGRPVDFASPAAAIAAGLAFAPEDRKRDGLVLSMSVAANASMASLERTLRGGLVSPAREAAHVRPYLERFRLKAASLAQDVLALSGGNQQKVILARWLATGPRVLLLDEPTRGIDINAKREIYAFIDQLAAQGLGLIVVSSEMPELMALADRILVMCEGRVTAGFLRREATAERILAAALPAAAGAP